MRAGAYARVSSASQRERDTIESQLRMLPEFIARMGWQLVATYIDDGRSAKSGRLDKRTGFAELLADVAAGKLDVVVVVDIDRLTRAEDLTERGAILGALQHANVKIASAMSGQVLDLSTSQGDLLSSLAAFFAAEWGRKHRARIIEGKLTAISRGKKPSGPTPYGHRYDRASGTWSVHPENGPLVVEMFERVIAGESCYAICEDFLDRNLSRPRGKWTRERVWGVVRSRHTVGEWTVDKRRELVIAVPPIVTEETWQRAQQALLKHGKRGLRRTKHTYLLEGLGRCSLCNSAMLIRSATAGRNGHPNPAAYVCRQRKFRIRGAPRCIATIVPTAIADARVWAKLCEMISKPEVIEVALAQQRSSSDDPQDWKADAEGYRRHVARLDRAESALLARFSRGTVSELALDTALANINRERDAVREQLQNAERAALVAATAHTRVDDAMATLARMRPILPNASPRARRELVAMFIRPGSVRFVGREIQLVATIPTKVAAESRDAHASLSLAPASDWSGDYQSELQIRLVA